ncbi:MAG: GTPase [Thermodesulfobacteriota bacterium]
MNTIDEYQIKVKGRLSMVREDIAQIQSTLEQAPHWLPGHGLLAECRAARELLEKMEERPIRKVVVTLVGPSGAGKSTLLNALAAEDRLSPVGVNRPTTRKAVLYTQSVSDADFLLKDIDAESLTVEARPLPGLEHLILIDTPDMDSMESEVFHPLLENIILQTDVLICVLNAENPKRRDTVVFLKRFVDLFPGWSLYVVLNRCDRLPETELKGFILTDLQRHLKDSWKRTVDQVFLISARRHLQDPSWPEDEKPRHDFDQFPQLKGMVFGALNRSDHAVDIRLEQADHLLGLVRKSVGQSLSEIGEGLVRVKKDLSGLEQKAVQEARSAMKDIGPGMTSGIQALFYQKLTERWWGPVGWLVALWTRFLMAGAGMLTTIRSGNPVLQLWGLVSSLARFQKTRRTVEEAAAGGDMSSVLLKYRLTIQQAWPDLAGRLMDLGFNHEVRRNALVLRDENELQQTLVSSWKNTLEEEMNRRIGKISSFILQLLFNLPTLVVLGLFTYQSVGGFLRQEIHSSAYFLHAAVSILLVALLSFFLLQILVRFVGGWNLIQAVTKGLAGLLESAGSQRTDPSLLEEIEAVLRLREGK